MAATKANTSPRREGAMSFDAPSFFDVVLCSSQDHYRRMYPGRCFRSNLKSQPFPFITLDI